MATGPAKRCESKEEKCGKINLLYIYSPQKIATRLPALQNIFGTQLMAIHHTLSTISKTFPNKHTHIFKNFLNGPYVIKKTIEPPTPHNKYLDKTIYKIIIQLHYTKIQLTTLHKVTTHANIARNKEAITHF